MLPLTKDNLDKHKSRLLRLNSESTPKQPQETQRLVCCVPNERSSVNSLQVPFHPIMLISKKIIIKFTLLNHLSHFRLCIQFITGKSIGLRFAAKHSRPHVISSCSFLACYCKRPAWSPIFFSFCLVALGHINFLLTFGFEQWDVLFVS